MPLAWYNLKQYKCPICGAPLKDKQTIHQCSSCSFSISDEKLSKITVLRHRPLDPPEFIKEIRKAEKPSLIKRWVDVLKNL